MFFRNLTCFRFPAGIEQRFVGFGGKVFLHELQPCAAFESESRGWVSPYGRDERMLAVELMGFTLVALGSNTKILPMSVVQVEVAKRAKEIEQLRGTPVGNRERRKLKDEVLNTLLPNALVRPGRIGAYLDFANGWVVVDASSRRSAESVVSAIRQTIGRFPAVGLGPEESPRAVMTEWLVDGHLPEGFALGDECVLKDPADRGAQVRCSRQDLGADEMREHLSAGKQCSALALTYQDRMRFVLDETLAVRKFKLLDIAVESLEKGDRDSAKAELDARFILMTGEVTRLLAALETVFGVPRPQAP